VRPSKLQLVLLAAGVCLALGLAALALAGCAAVPTASPTPQASPPATRAVGAPTPALTAAPETPQAIITLTIWTIPRFAPGDPSAASRLLAAQAEAFGRAYPNYRLDWVVRPPAGSGGVIDFLLAAHEAAPAILPDVAVLDSREIGAAMRAGLLQPLDGVISDSIKADLFPFARNASTLDDQWYAVPFEADIEHLLYSTTSVDAAPLTWTDVFSSGLRYAFPAGGENGRVNDMLLIQYLALGGRLSDQNGQPTLDEAPLTTALSFYADGRQFKSLPVNIVDLKTAEEALALFVSDTVNLCNVRSDLYLAARPQLKDAAFASLPTWNGTVATMGRSRALVLVAPDPERIHAAGAFLEWFADPERNAAWTRAAGRLPARQASIALWGSSDTYVTFVRWQLASAYYIPSLPEYDRTYLALQQAVRDVLTGGATAGDAARHAIAAVLGKG